MDFRHWLKITLAWLLFTTGFVLWLWTPGIGSILGALLSILTSNYAFMTLQERRERRESLDRQVGKRELIGIVLLLAGVTSLVLLAFFTQGRDWATFDVKEKLREPLFALVLYALVAVPTLRRWHRRLARIDLPVAKERERKARKSPPWLG